MLMARGSVVRNWMDKGGWLAIEGFMAYDHDVEAVRRTVVDQLLIGAPAKKESA